MTETNFFYWIQGYFELTKLVTLTSEQVNIIKDHVKITTDRTENIGKIDILCDLMLQDCNYDLSCRMKCVVESYFEKKTRKVIFSGNDTAGFPATISSSSKKIC